MSLNSYLLNGLEVELLKKDLAGLNDVCIEI